LPICARRALRTEFTDRWQQRRDEARTDPTVAATEIASAAAEGRLEDLVVVGGQSAGLIGGLLPVADIVRMLLSEAEAAIADAGRLLS
jgi:nitronate monooxygenase/enoyl-[acyl-carrier protein] reductase II